MAKPVLTPRVRFHGFKDSQWLPLSLHCCFYPMLHLLSSFNILILPYSSLQPPLFSFFPAHHLCPFIPPPKTPTHWERGPDPTAPASSAHPSFVTPVPMSPLKATWKDQPMLPNHEIPVFTSHSEYLDMVVVVVWVQSLPSPAQRSIPSKTRFVSKVCVLAPVWSDWISHTSWIAGGNVFQMWC